MIGYQDVTVRVRYAETDQMGVVYHSNYLIWFEVGRVEIMRSLGFDYKRMEIEDDCYLVVADVHCRYHHPARYDELITVRTRILEAKNLSSLSFAQPGVTGKRSLHGYDQLGHDEWNHSAAMGVWARHLQPEHQPAVGIYLSRQWLL